MRSALFSLCLVLGSLLALPAGAQSLPRATPEELGLSEEALAKLDEGIEGLVKGKALPGAVVMIARHGKVAYHKAFGMRDVASAKPMKPDTIFRFYSMTKPVTSVAVMMLVEQGRIALDDPVAKHLPAFKDLQVLENGKRVRPARAMTVRDLLRHTSGLSYGYFSQTEVDKMYLEQRVFDFQGTIEDMVNKLGKIPLLYQPGKRWHYSASVDVLGRLVEVASGERFDRFLKKHIFDPLGMKDTGFHVPKGKHVRLVTNYRPDGLGGITAIETPGPDPFLRPGTFFSGGGGLVSTADDYMRFALMLQNRGAFAGTRLLESKTVAEMTRNQLPEELVPITINGFTLPGTGFGLGVSVQFKPSPITPPSALGEFGWSGAASTSFWIAPKEELVVICLTQVMPFSTQLLLTVKPQSYAAITKPMKKAKKFW